jgi:hypothetical protein
MKRTVEKRHSDNHTESDAYDFIMLNLDDMDEMDDEELQDYYDSLDF